MLLQRKESGRAYPKEWAVEAGHKRDTVSSDLSQLIQGGIKSISNRAEDSGTITERLTYMNIFPLQVLNRKFIDLVPLTKSERRLTERGTEVC